MDWLTIGVGALMSAFVGTVVWVFLPRGVALTRTPLSDVRDDSCGPVLDRWLLKNESPVPARIASVRLKGISGESVPGPRDADGDSPLVFDDEVDEIARQERQIPWSKAIVRPGDALVAHVKTNHDLEIRYRRAGWTGFAERRRIAVRGGP